MSDQQAPGFKPKKSVALSGVTAGNTALCTVGKTGNDREAQSPTVVTPVKAVPRKGAG